MKIKIRTNFRIEVLPDFPFQGNRNEQEQYEYMYGKCRQIQRDIHRHIDDVREASVLYDTEERCGFCKMKWEEDEDGLPQCCNKAQEEFGIKV